MYAEAYLEPTRTSTVGLPWENHKKALLQMLKLVLNMPLA